MEVELISKEEFKSVKSGNGGKSVSAFNSEYTEDLMTTLNEHGGQTFKLSLRDAINNYIGKSGNAEKSIMQFFRRTTRKLGYGYAKRVKLDKANEKVIICLE